MIIERTKVRPVKAIDYMTLKKVVIEAGYAGEVDWAGSISVCNRPELFLEEYIWVVINAGMREQVARKIYKKVMEVLFTDIAILDVFAHVGKAAAITKMACCYEEQFLSYCAADDKLVFLKTLGWIGDITKYHLAKNLGVQCVKPDRHLVRIAKLFGVKPLEMCLKISEQTGDMLTEVDQVIWRAANLGLI